MTIVVTGGGSGGHITPILAVAHELKQLCPDVTIVYIGQKGDPFADVPERDPNIDAVYRISAGKLRRYYGEGLRQLLDFKTMHLNIRDMFRVVRGIGQARRLMKQLQPTVVFSRGGYVSVPVALGARARGIPYITHDSDAIPSLANRLIAKRAAKNAVALPTNIYPYDQSKTVTVGVPVMAAYTRITPELQMQYRSQLSIPADAAMVFVTGGGQGAVRINDALIAQAAELFSQNPQLFLTHQAGQANEAAVRAAYASKLTPEQLQRVRVFGYMDDIFLYCGAANVVVARAGASSIADLAVQGKATIIVPSPFLTGGHQLKNAQFLADQQAAEVIDEITVQKHPEQLTSLISSVLADPVHQAELGEKLTALGHPNSARELAQLILDQASIVMKLRIGKRKQPERPLTRVRRDSSWQRPSAYSYHAQRAERPQAPNRQQVNVVAKRQRLISLQYWGKRSGTLAIAVITLIFVISMLSVSSRPRIILLDANNTYAFHDNDTYRQAASQYIAGSLLNRNKITLNTGGASKDLRQRFPELAQVNVTLPLIGHRPVFYLLASAPAFVLQTSTGTFVLDGNGKALLNKDAAPAAVVAKLPVITDQTTNRVTPGQQVLSSSDTTFIRTIVATFAAKQVTVTSLVLPATAVQELDAKVVGQNYVIKFDMHQSGAARQQAGAYLATANTLVSQQKTPGQYIDVRVLGRVYYQ